MAKSPKSLRRPRADASHDLTKQAQAFLERAYDCANETYKAMQVLRDTRGVRTGRPSYQDQDLLRAMLVFACAGVDAAMKTLVREAIPALVDHNNKVEAELTKFAERYLGRGDRLNAATVARVLTGSDSPRINLIDAFVDDLTGGSLQSPEELKRVRTALGLSGDHELLERINNLQDAFDARNTIIHELDLRDINSGRTRIERGIAEMVGWSEDALDVAQRLIRATDKVLDTP